MIPAKNPANPAKPLAGLARSTLESACACVAVLVLWCKLGNDASPARTPPVPWGKATEVLVGDAFVEMPKDAQKRKHSKHTSDSPPPQRSRFDDAEDGAEAHSSTGSASSSRSVDGLEPNLSHGSEQGSTGLDATLDDDGVDVAHQILESEGGLKLSMSGDEAASPGQADAEMQPLEVQHHGGSQEDRGDRDRSGDETVVGGEGELGVGTFADDPDGAHEVLNWRAQQFQESNVPAYQSLLSEMTSAQQAVADTLAAMHERMTTFQQRFEPLVYDARQNVELNKRALHNWNSARGTLQGAATD